MRLCVRSIVQISELLRVLPFAVPFSESKEVPCNPLFAACGPMIFKGSLLDDSTALLGGGVHHKFNVETLITLSHH